MRRRVYKTVVLVFFVLVAVQLLQASVSVAKALQNEDNTVFQEEIVSDATDLQSSHDYAPNLDKNWVYQVADATQITLAFCEDTYVEAGCDYLYIYDKDANLIGCYTGGELARQTVTVPGDTVKIRLKTDDSTQEYGFCVKSVSATVDISKASTTASVTSWKCSATGAIPTIKVIYDNKELTKDVDYTETVSGNTAKIVGKGSYIGARTLTLHAPANNHSYANACDTSCDSCGTKRTTSHDYAAATCAEPKICKVCGVTSGNALVHKYDNACDTSCNRCGATRKTSHNYAAATCTKAKTCTACKVTSGNALGHKYDNACDTVCNTCSAKRTIKHSYAAATCAKAKTCNVCGATSGNALGHKYDNACDASCNTCGAKRTIKHSYAAATCTKAKTCKVCKVTSGKKLGHSYKAATCTKPKTCNRCGATSGKELGHAYEATITKATPKKNGKAVKVCKACDKKVTQTLYKIKSVNLSTTSYTYNGKAKKPSVTVKDYKGNKLKEGTDYTVTYDSGRENVGKYEVKVKFKGGYSGSKTLTFEIKPMKVTKCTAYLSATSYTYNGKKKTPAVTVKNSSGKKLKEGTDYTVTYASGRKKVGTYKVTVKMKGNYSGTQVLEFKIKPKAASINKLTAKTKALTVKLNRQLTQATGYQIQYATSKGFDSAKTVTVSDYKTNTKTISKLKKKTKYYVRVRTYKTVDGVKYYSNWSTAKSLKTK